MCARGQSARASKRRAARSRLTGASREDDRVRVAGRCCLGTQIGGETSTGSLPADPTRRWRCSYIDEIDNVVDHDGAPGKAPTTTTPPAPSPPSTAWRRPCARAASGRSGSSTGSNTSSTLSRAFSLISATLWGHACAHHLRKSGIRGGWPSRGCISHRTRGALWPLQIAHM